MRARARSGQRPRGSAGGRPSRGSRDLGDRVDELLVAREVVGPEADPGARTEVADDLAFAERALDRLEVGDVERHRAATAPGSRGERIAKPASWARSIRSWVWRSECARMRSTPDLLDEVVAGRRGVERGHVGRPGEEAGDPFGVAQLGLEGERRRVRLPADEARRELADQVRANVEPAVPRPAAEPLDRAAHGEVDPERARRRKGRSPPTGSSRARRAHRPRARAR